MMSKQFMCSTSVIITSPINHLMGGGILHVMCGDLLIFANTRCITI